MKYALLIYSRGRRLGRPLGGRADAIYGEYAAVSQSPGIVGGAAAPARRTPRPPCASPTASTLTTDGPFAETKEGLGGFFLLEADNLDDAIAFAARIPAARMGGAVEVRPLVEL